MSKKQKILSIYDRILIDKLFKEKGDKLGDLTDLRISFNIGNKIDFTDEEINEYELYEFYAGNQVIKNWNANAENQEKPFFFTSKERTLIKRLINERSGSWEGDEKTLDFIKKFDISPSEELSGGDDDISVSLNVFDYLTLQKVVWERKTFISSYNDIAVYCSVAQKLILSKEYENRNKVTRTDDAVIWDKEAAPEEVKFTDKEFNLLKNFLQEKRNWAYDRRIFDLVKKFGVEIPIENDEEEDEGESD